MVSASSLGGTSADLLRRQPGEGTMQVHVEARELSPFYNLIQQAQQRLYFTGRPAVGLTGSRTPNKDSRGRLELNAQDLVAA